MHNISISLSLSHVVMEHIMNTEYTLGLVTLLHRDVIIKVSLSVIDSEYTGYFVSPFKL